MRKLSLFFTLLFIVILVAPASAIDKTGKIAIGGYAGYSFGFGDVFKKQGFDTYWYNYSYQSKVTFSLGALIKYGLTKNIAVSLALNYQRTKREAEYSYGTYNESISTGGHWPALLVNGILILIPERKTCPYLTGGGGLYIQSVKRGEDYSWDTDPDPHPGINLGGGVEHFLQNDLALDGGARLHLIFMQDKMATYLQLYAGVNFYPF